MMLNRGLIIPKKIQQTMMIRKSFILFFSSFSSVLFAQHTEQQQWMYAVAKYNISDNFSASLEESWRTSEWSQSGQTYTNIGLNYKINKKFRAGFDYRIIQQGSFLNTYKLDNRYSFDISFREKIGDIRFSLKSKFQSRYRDIFTSKYGKIPQNYSRNKIEFSYKLPNDLTLALSTEFFIHLSEAKDQNKYLDEIRYGLTAEYKLNKQHSISLYGYYRDKMNYENPENIAVIGIGYEFLINPGSKDAAE